MINYSVVKNDTLAKQPFFYPVAQITKTTIMNINELFFELIRVSIGTQDRLSRPPSKSEWAELYDMSKKQSLIGICFAGIQRLNSLSPSLLSQLPEVNYLRWMGMAAKIQQRNEVVNRQCVELQERLAADGMRTCILKGQGVAQLYGKQLCRLRQSGDIDIWVQNQSIEGLVEYVQGLGVDYKATVAHVECGLFPDTEVELHAYPAFMRNFSTNRKLVQWFNNSKGSIVESELGFSVPTLEFNLVYMMVHMYHHVLFEGLGLRQLMDYYFVLLAANKIKTIKTPEGSASACKDEIENKFSSSSSQASADSHTVDLDPFGKKQQKQLSIPSVLSVLDSLGMKRFATGIMWIMKEVFALEDRYMICEANEKYGRLILEDVMPGGNFGHHGADIQNLHSDSAIGRLISGLKRNMKFFALGPWEILCTPFWSLWHYVWRKRYGYM